jgi:uncharacterized protein YlxP (DUF503 family)
MIIGALRLTFVVPADGSSTHNSAQKIKDRLWSKFKLALAELPSHSGTQVVIGGALVGSDEGATQKRVDDIIRHLNDWGAVELVNDEMELIYFDDLELERDFEKYDP